MDFIIPANTVKQFHAVYKIPTQVSLLGIWPHCHMLGKDWGSVCFITKWH
ncbi:MAG: hypothetical protein IPO78_16475 [Saprospiraceae bacterium]|nr:hypothetical protein [Saprospiraceae bacterium]